MSSSGTWYALLSAEELDRILIRQHFTAPDFVIEVLDDQIAISTSYFKNCANYEAVAAEAKKLIDLINVSLRVANKHYRGVSLNTVVLKDGDDFKIRAMQADATVFVMIPGAVGHALAGNLGTPVRSKEDRLLSVMARSPEVQEVARELAIRPVSWAALFKTVETVQGLMSSKGDKTDYQNLIALGWVTPNDSYNFFHSASFARHGFPKSPNKARMPMDYDIAYQFAFGLLWRLVDHLEPR